ncbi:MAG: glutamate synthase central domain-containing protein, partial [Candidatus Limnocylindrales bacterium]
PLLRDAALTALADPVTTGWRVRRLDATWPVSAGPAGLRTALDRLVEGGLRAACAGVDLLIVSDAGAGPGRVALPSLLAVGALHAALTAAGRRSGTDLVADAGDVFEIHALAMLLAAGASAVHPRELLALAREQAGSRGNEGLDAVTAEAHLVAALDGGLRKVLARMGISTIAAYRGGQLFEILGLSAEVAERCFPAAPLTAGSTGFERLAGELLERHAAAWGPERVPGLPDPGSVRFRSEGELHGFAPKTVRAIQALASARLDERVDPLPAYRAVLDRSEPGVVRDLLVVAPARTPVPLAEVEPVEAITGRFVSSAMSLGALSPEAHRAIAVGMRRLGGAANTGEGGEDEACYETDERDEP